MAEQIQQVTTKDPKKVEAGKRLAENKRRKRERMKLRTAKLSFLIRVLEPL